MASGLNPHDHPECDDDGGGDDDGDDAGGFLLQGDYYYDVCGTRIPTELGHLDRVPGSDA